MKKTMDHAAYKRSMKQKTEAELKYIMKDAFEAATAMPDGINAGYYMDEMHYADAELQRRKLIVDELRRMK
jgi:hypothetical protein